MLYTIILLLAGFSVISLLLYLLLPGKYKYIALLSTSMLFFFYYSRAGLIYLLITIVTTYLAGRIIEHITINTSVKGLEKDQRKAVKAKAKQKKKIIVVIYMIVNLGILFLLKYAGMFGSTEALPSFFKIALPFGISYYTLQSMGYVIDIYRGKYHCEKNILKIGLFICFFPQLHEGPFGRYDEIIVSLCTTKQIKFNNLLHGSARILWGIFKLFMIANRASIISDAVFNSPGTYGGSTILLGGIAFTIQLYAEFSGYIDIAIGISSFWDIKLVENFNLPFLAQSVADFWRRWHISLGRWFRDYVFYPLSTSKWLNNLTGRLPEKAGDFINISTSLFFVWFLTGLWHGASWKYVCYGLYYFVLMIIYNLTVPLFQYMWKKAGISYTSIIPSAIRIVITQFFVLIGMIMFRAENLKLFTEMMVALFHSGKSLDLFVIMDYKDWIVLMLSLLLMLLTAFLKAINFNLNEKLCNLNICTKYILCFVSACIIIIFGAYGLGYTPPDPIYGGF